MIHRRKLLLALPFVAGTCLLIRGGRIAKAQEKKREAPAAVPPVIIAGIRYEAVAFGLARGWKQNGGYVVAYDEITGNELWKARIYDVNYDETMEADKQDVFIVAMAPCGTNVLCIEDELSRRFRLSLESREAVRVE